MCLPFSFTSSLSASGFAGSPEHYKHESWFEFMRLRELLSVLVFPLLGCFWMLFDYQQWLCMWSVTVQDSEGSYVILLRLQWQQAARQNSSTEGKRHVGPEASLLLQTIHRTASQGSLTCAIRLQSGSAELGRVGDWWMHSVMQLEYRTTSCSAHNTP